MSALPSTFHKRYLMNFTILTLEQQRIMRDSQRTAQEHRARDGRAGWREYGAGRRRAATGNNVGETALLRELSRQGLLEREEVKAMLRTGPLQDFRGFVLQVCGDTGTIKRREEALVARASNGSMICVRHLSRVFPTSPNQSSVGAVAPERVLQLVFAHRRPLVCNP